MRFLSLLVSALWGYHGWSGILVCLLSSSSHQVLFVEGFSSLSERRRGPTNKPTRPTMISSRYSMLFRGPFINDDSFCSPKDYARQQRPVSRTVSNNDDGSFQQQSQRRNFLFYSAAAMGLLTVQQPFAANAAYIDPATTPPTITDKVYLDVEWVDTTTLPQKGRITIGLFGEAMPKCVENFVTLCKRNDYAGSSFYRIISEYSIQGGSIGGGGESSGQSAFGGTFEPDNFNLQHTQKGLVSMVKAKTGGVDSRFFIQLQDDAGWADDRYAAFGIVLGESSWKVIDALTKLPVQPPKNNPKQPVTIVASGIL